MEPTQNEGISTINQIPKKINKIKIVSIAVGIFALAIIAFSYKSDVLKNYIKADEKFAVGTSSVVVSTELLSDPYVNKNAAFQISLPKDWKFVNDKQDPPVIKNIVLFTSEKSELAVMTISKFDNSEIRKKMMSQSDAEIIKTISEESSSFVSKTYEAIGLKGFNISGKKVIRLGSDTGHMYKGTGYTGTPKNEAYGFEFITIFEKGYGYQIFAMWPESIYTKDNSVIKKSINSFRIIK